MDFESEFASIAQGFNIATPDGSKACYLQCHKYAKAHIPNILRRNEFMFFCSEKLSEPWIHEVLYPPIEGDEKIDLAVSDARVTVCANKPGLRYLASVATLLSNSNLPGEHIHVEQDDDLRFDSAYGLDFIYKDNSWFSKGSKSNVVAANIPIRTIKTNDLGALMFTTPIPIYFATQMEQYEIYQIIEINPYSDTSPEKKLRDDLDRMINVNFIGKNQTLCSLNIDIDDTEIILFTIQQLQKIKNMQLRSI